MNAWNSRAPHNLDKRTTITIDDKTFVVEADDLEKISDLGVYLEQFIELRPTLCLKD